MHRPLNVRRAIALTAALVVTGWGATALPAAAEKGGSTQGTNHRHTHTSDTPEGDAPTGGTGSTTSDEPSGDASGSTDPQTGDQTSGGTGTGTGTQDDGTQDDGKATDGSTQDPMGESGTDDPAGNNGTVKVAPYGEIDSIPQNTPHPGCTFEIEWYGYDEGADIVSHVSFAMQAPTKDAGLTVDGPAEVPVGGDPATGAGTETGLDGRETYTLSFTGTPQAQQGYHVKLTVATPHSLGNDTKTKVFWVEPCEESATGAEADDTEVLGTQASTGSPSSSGADTQVRGAQAAANQAGSGSGVPTVVDAGELGRAAVAGLTGSPWPLALVGAGSLLTAGAVVSRRRRRASDASAQ